MRPSPTPFAPPGSRARTSAASTGCAARAPSCSTATRCARASCSRRRPTGRRVDTVESLGTPDALHPAQEALRDARGLQCGFCTPGVAVLSAWLREREPEADEARIREVLSSSLCRCTGYGPIVAAASRR